LGKRLAKNRLLSCRGKPRKIVFLLTAFSLTASRFSQVFAEGKKL
jgi:hypothetical protein